LHVRSILLSVLAFVVTQFSAELCVAVSAVELNGFDVCSIHRNFVVHTTTQSGATNSPIIFSSCFRIACGSVSPCFDILYCRKIYGSWRNLHTGVFGDGAGVCVQASQVSEQIMRGGMLAKTLKMT
jgi:hypothetical protein